MQVCTHTYELVYSCIYTLTYECVCEHILWHMALSTGVHAHTYTINQSNKGKGERYRREEIKAEGLKKTVEGEPRKERREEVT